MKRKEVCLARSKNNGIFFYSNIFPRIGTETIRDEDGKIKKSVTLITANATEEADNE